MLLKEYADYLGSVNVGKGTTRTYCRKLQKFLDNGYSENDLIGAVDKLISTHSKGGSDYDEKDSGNTAAALSKLKDYIQAPYIDNFFIAYEKGFSSTVLQKRYVSAYTITDGTITITYKTGHFPEKTVTKKISKVQYRNLIDIFIKYQDHLSKADTAISTVHGSGPAYRYVFGKCYGSNCAELFEGKNAAHALSEYKAWIGKYIS